jgi:Ca2+-binding EF-hand superfamily protein
VGALNHHLGRDGELFKEMEEYFYYAQLEHQGLNTMGKRSISDYLPLSEVPKVFRALGFYPSERDIQDFSNEVRLSTYRATGAYVDKIDLPTFIKLFANHKPAFGLGEDELDAGFAALSPSGQISSADLVAALGSEVGAAILTPRVHQR